MYFWQINCMLMGQIMHLILDAFHHVCYLGCALSHWCHAHTNTYMHMYIHTYVHMHVHMYAHMYVCTHMYIHTYIHMYVCMHVCIYIHRYVYTYHISVGANLRVQVAYDHMTWSQNNIKLCPPFGTRSHETLPLEARRTLNSSPLDPEVH